MAGSYRTGPAGPAGPSKLQVAHDEEAPPDDDLKKKHEVVEGAKGLEHGHGIVRKSVNGDVSR